MSGINENRLILEILSDDVRVRKEALQEVYDRGFNQVKAMVLNLGGTNDHAKDVFQEGVVILYQNLKLDKFKGQSSVYTYLTNICRNRFYKLYQTEISTASMKPNLSDDEALSPIIDPQIVKRVIDELSSGCRKILMAFYYQKKTMSEIARLFGLGNDQVARNKKSRCMKSLSEKVREMNLTMESFMK